MRIDIQEMRGFISSNWILYASDYTEDRKQITMKYRLPGYSSDITLYRVEISGEKPYDFARIEEAVVFFNSVVRDKFPKRT